MLSSSYQAFRGEMRRNSVSADNGHGFDITPSPFGKPIWAFGKPIPARQPYKKSPKCREPRGAKPSCARKLTYFDSLVCSQRQQFQRQQKDAHSSDCAMETSISTPSYPKHVRRNAAPPRRKRKLTRQSVNKMDTSQETPTHQNQLCRSPTHRTLQFPKERPLAEIFRLSPVPFSEYANNESVESIFEDFFSEEPPTRSWYID
eukprot:gb/GEZN01014077.1/.p1 GENE.gb/GEZN01014077.1/~~gb/GEZN01014077.1/.p1  ORF type:complete len:203 (-),score=8.93 gb/GEZN01014077.1/:277-885(-)